MAENDDRMTRFEERLDAVGADVGVLKGDVQVVKGDVQVLKEDVQVLKEDVQVLKGDVQVLKGDVQVLKDDVQRLRVLSEEHDTKIDTIAEVQAHHGDQLDEHGKLLRDIKQELTPLGDIRDFVRRVADDHERRLVALEKHTGIR